MRASIIIVTYGQREVTERCLRSLERCLGDRLGADWELVLVDNNSPDDTPAMLQTWSDRARVLLLPENRNFAGGCNAGAAAARGEVLLFLNNDTEVTPGALETVVEQALEPGVAVAGCRLLFPDGTVQHAGVAFVHGMVMGGAPMPQHVFHHQDQELPPTRAVYELDCVTAACMAVRAVAFDAVGGFDGGYRNGLEDVDLCLKIRVTGQRIVYRGDVTVIHHEGASRGRDSALWATPEKLAIMHANDVRFVERWAASLGQDDELAAELWDAALEGRPPERSLRTADVVVQGQPGGLGPAADEARAFLSLFHRYGEVVAAADVPVPIVVPRLNPAMTSLLEQARRRLAVPGARTLVIPAGRHDRHDAGPYTVIRAAGAQAAVRADDAMAVWATCPAVAEELVAAGVAAGRVIVVPPPILETSPGPGGDGVLALLPVHDRTVARAVLEALGALAPSVPLRVLPTILTRNLGRDLAQILPRAELLPPCSDEARFAGLAATADVVVALDPSDRFDRRALVAAGAGAAPLTDCAGGPATAVLGAGVCAAGEQLAARLVELVSEPGERAERARAVFETCSPEALAPVAGLRSAAAL